jgi:hypothetical protein
MDTGDQSPVTTKRRVLAQLVVCKGCCCGQIDKGLPAVPEERLKSTWKKERLLKTIQLTISGCVGPCDVANVIQIITPDGVEWYGNLDRSVYYDALIDWARTCISAGKLLPRPAVLNTRRFSGYL